MGMRGKEQRVGIGQVRVQQQRGVQATPGSMIPTAWYLLTLDLEV